MRLCGGLVLSPIWGEGLITITLYKSTELGRSLVASMLFAP